MANTWNIPDWLEAEVRARGKICVYCNTPFKDSKVSKKAGASGAPIINDEKMITRESMALAVVDATPAKEKNSFL